MSFNPLDPDEQPNNVPHDVKVSVRMSTYNHAPYIRQAIESVLMQRTDFNFELCIGEDDSTDGTREICKEYAAKHPDKIRLFLRHAKDKIYVNGRMTGRLNGRKTRAACRGEYIALLEGDDFWIDPLKLQRQADFLDANERCSICGTQTLVLEKSRAYVNPGFFVNDFDLERLLGPWSGFNTASFVHRATVIFPYDKWGAKTILGDWSLLVSALEDGSRFHILPYVSAVYRVHSGGMWQGSNLSKADVKSAMAGKLEAYRPYAPRHHWRKIDGEIRFYRLAQAVHQATTLSKPFVFLAGVVRHPGAAKGFIRGTGEKCVLSVVRLAKRFILSKRIRMAVVMELSRAD